MPADPKCPSSSPFSRYLVNRATESRTLTSTLPRGEFVRAWCWTGAGGWGVPFASRFHEKGGGRTKTRHQRGYMWNSPLSVSFSKQQATSFSVPAKQPRDTKVRWVRHAALLMCRSSPCAVALGTAALERSPAELASLANPARVRTSYDLYSVSICSTYPETCPPKQTSGFIIRTAVAVL